MKRIVALGMSLAVLCTLVGCSGETISEEDSIGADLKRAGVNPVGEPKGGAPPKTGDKPAPPKGN